MNNLASENVTLPSGATATVRELTGAEEDLLLNERLVKTGKVVHRLLGNILTSLNGVKPNGEAINNMWSADRFAVVLKARILSFGPEFETQHECGNPDCKRPFTVTADLGTDLQFQARPEKLEGANLEYTFDLADGTPVTVRPLKGSDEDFLRRAKEQGSLLTELIFRRTVRYGDLEDRNELRQFLERAPLRVRGAIRKAFTETEFGYQQGVIATCPICGTEQQIDLISSSGFFFPGEGQENAAQ